MTLKLMQLPGPPCGGESPKRMMATTKCGSAQEGDRGGSHSADALSNLQLGPKPVPREDREQPEVRLVDLHITGLPTHWNVEQYAPSIQRQLVRPQQLLKSVLRGSKSPRPVAWPLNSAWNR